MPPSSCSRAQHVSVPSVAAPTPPCPLQRGGSRTALLPCSCQPQGWGKECVIPRTPNGMEAFTAFLLPCNRQIIWGVLGGSSSLTITEQGLLRSLGIWERPMHGRLFSLLPRKLCQISELYSSPSGDMLSIMNPKVSLSPTWVISYTSNIHPMRGVPKLYPMRKSSTILKRGKDPHSWLIPNIILTSLAKLVAGNYWCVQHHLQTGVTLASYLSKEKLSG